MPFHDDAPTSVPTSDNGDRQIRDPLSDKPIPPADCPYDGNPPPRDGGKWDASSSSPSRSHAGQQPNLDQYRVSPENEGAGTLSASEGATGRHECDCPNPVPLWRDVIDRRPATKGVVSTAKHWMPCRRKSCSHCGPILRKRYVAHYARTFERLHREGYDLHFVTLTVDPKIRGKGDPIKGKGDPLRAGEESKSVLNEVWEAYYEKLRYRTGGDWKYVACFEQHKNGHYHMHVVLAVKWREDWTGAPATDQEANRILRRCWFKAGGGAVVDVKKIHPSTPTGTMGADGRPESVRGAAGYVVKYVFKEQYGKRIRTSNGIGYDSERARRERREYAREHSDGGGRGYEAESDESTHVEYRPVQRRRSNDDEGSSMSEDIRSLDDFDLSQRTQIYRVKQDNGTWKVHRADGEEATFTTWPKADEARMINSSPGWTESEAWEAARAGPQ